MMVTTVCRQTSHWSSNYDGKQLHLAFHAMKCPVLICVHSQTQHSWYILPRSKVATNVISLIWYWRISPSEVALYLSLKGPPNIVFQPLLNVMLRGHQYHLERKYYPGFLDRYFMII